VDLVLGAWLVIELFVLIMFTSGQGDIFVHPEDYCVSFVE
jgi:hypothetical protein